MKKFTKILGFITVCLILFISVQTLKVPVSNFLNRDKEDVSNGEEKKVSTKISYKSHLDKGDHRFANGYYTLAIAQYTQASQAEPQFIEPYMKIAQAHIAQKNYEKAIENYRIASQIEPENLTSKIRIGEMYINLSEFDKAEKLFNTIPEENADIFYFRAVMNIFYQKYEDARYNLKKAQELSSDGAIYMSQLQNLKRAFELFDMSEGANITYLRTLLAKTMGEIGYNAMAKEIIYSVLEENPLYRDAWIILGYTHLKTENYFDAVSSLKEAEKIDPFKAETLYFLGQALSLQGEKNAALEKLEKAYTYGFEPASTVVLEIANLYLEKKDYKKSAEYFEKSTHLNPEYLDAYIKTIWLNLDYLENPVKARQIALDAQKNHPDNALSYNLVGWTEIVSGNLDSAKKNLDRALEIDKNLASAYLNMGILLEAQADTEGAKVNYVRAFELEKTSAIGVKAKKLYDELIAKEAESLQND